MPPALLSSTSNSPTCAANSRAIRSASPRRLKSARKWPAAPSSRWVAAVFSELRPTNHTDAPW